MATMQTRIMPRKILGHLRKFAFVCSEKHQAVLPAAAPHIFTGLRVAFGIAVIVAVVVELVAGFGGGLGDFIGVSRGALRIPDVYAGIVLVSVLGYLIGQLLAAVEHRLMAWHRGFKEQARRGSPEG